MKHRSPMQTKKSQPRVNGKCRKLGKCRLRHHPFTIELGFFGLHRRPRIDYICLFSQTSILWQLLYFQVRTTCFSLGFTIAFGALFSKTWRVYKIFTNKKLLKMVNYCFLYLYLLYAVSNTTFISVIRLLIKYFVFSQLSVQYLMQVRQTRILYCQRRTHY